MKKSMTTISLGKIKILYETIFIRINYTWEIKKTKNQFIILIIFMDFPFNSKSFF